MKLEDSLNLIIAIFFSVLLYLSNLTYVTWIRNETIMTDIRIFGLQLGFIKITWQAVLGMLIIILLLYLVVLILDIVKIVKGINLIKLKSVQILASLFIVGLSIYISLNNIEEFQYSPLYENSYTPYVRDYSRVLDLDSDNNYIEIDYKDELIKIKTSSKAIKTIKKLRSKEGCDYIVIRFRKNKILSDEYKLAAIYGRFWNERKMEVESRLCYRSGFQNYDDYLNNDNIIYRWEWPPKEKQTQ